MGVSCMSSAKSPSTTNTKYRNLNSPSGSSHSNKLQQQQSQLPSINANKNSSSTSTSSSTFPSFFNHSFNGLKLFSSSQSSTFQNLQQLQQQLKNIFLEVDKHYADGCSKENDEQGMKVDKMILERQFVIKNLNPVLQVQVIAIEQKPHRYGQSNSVGYMTKNCESNHQPDPSSFKKAKASLTTSTTSPPQIVSTTPPTILTERLNAHIKQCLSKVSGLSHNEMKQLRLCHSIDREYYKNCIGLRALVYQCSSYVFICNKEEQQKFKRIEKVNKEHKEVLNKQKENSNSSLLNKIASHNNNSSEIQLVEVVYHQQNDAIQVNSITSQVQLNRLLKQLKQIYGDYKNDHEKGFKRYNLIDFGHVKGIWWQKQEQQCSKEQQQPQFLSNNIKSNIPHNSNSNLTFLIQRFLKPFTSSFQQNQQQQQQSNNNNNYIKENIKNNINNNINNNNNINVIFYNSLQIKKKENLICSTTTNDSKNDVQKIMTQQFLIESSYYEYANKFYQKYYSILDLNQKCLSENQEQANNPISSKQFSTFYILQILKLLLYQNQKIFGMDKKRYKQQQRQNNNSQCNFKYTQVLTTPISINEQITTTIQKFISFDQQMWKKMYLLGEICCKLSLGLTQSITSSGHNHQQETSNPTSTSTSSACYQNKYNLKIIPQTNQSQNNNNNKSFVTFAQIIKSFLIQQQHSNQKTLKQGLYYEFGIQPCQQLNLHLKLKSSQSTQQTQRRKVFQYKSFIHEPFIKTKFKNQQIANINKNFNKNYKKYYQQPHQQQQHPQQYSLQQFLNPNIKQDIEFKRVFFTFLGQFQQNYHTKLKVGSRSSFVCKLQAQWKNNVDKHYKQPPLQYSLSFSLSVESYVLYYSFKIFKIILLLQLGLKQPLVCSSPLQSTKDNNNSPNKNLLFDRLFSYLTIIHILLKRSYGDHRTNNKGNIVNVDILTTTESLLLRLYGLSMKCLLILLDQQQYQQRQQQEQQSQSQHRSQYQYSQRNYYSEVQPQPQPEYKNEKLLIENSFQCLPTKIKQEIVGSDVCENQYLENGGIQNNNIAVSHFIKLFTNLLGIHTNYFFNKSEIMSIISKNNNEDEFKSTFSQFFSAVDDCYTNLNPNQKLIELFQPNLSRGFSGIVIWGNSFYVKPLVFPLTTQFKKVFSLSCGHSHCVFSSIGGVWGFGENRSGQLCQESQKDKNDDKNKHLNSKNHKLYKLLETSKINCAQDCKISCGNEHTAVLLHKKLYTWGQKRNNIAPAPATTTTVNTATSATQHLKRYQFDHIYCGGLHTIGILDGVAYSWGRAEGGQLGQPLEELEKQQKEETIEFFVSKPKKIKIIENASNFSEPIIKASCGDAHTLLLTKSGYVYVCGFSYQGQLGLGITGDDQAFQIFQPKILQQLKQKKVFITDVFAGSTFSFFKSRQGKLYVCGLNDCQQLGVQRVMKVLKKNVKKKNNIGGGNTRKNAVAGSLGKFCRQMGQAQHSRPKLLQIFGQSLQLIPQQISCGQNHSIAIVRHGARKQEKQYQSQSQRPSSSTQQTLLMGWGSNKYGQLGEQFGTSTAPRTLQDFFEINTKLIGCGSDFSVAYVKEDNSKEGKQCTIAIDQQESSLSSHTKCSASDDCDNILVIDAFIKEISLGG